MRDDRAVLAAMAPVLMRTQPVAWAGARACSKGSALLRDGSVSRIVGAEAQVHAQVLEGGVVEYVTLAVRAEQLVATCSCDAAPCGHAVAVLMELQRKMRQVQQQDEQRSMVMSAVRDRLNGARTAAEAAPTRMLSNLERLPIEAAIDMVALAWRHALRPSPAELAELLTAVQRLDALVAQTPGRAAELAVVLLQALDAPKVVFVPLVESAESAVVRLVGIAIATAGAPPLAGAALETLVHIALEGQLQTAAHVAAGLDVAVQRDPALLAAAAALAQGWAQRPHAAWREVAVPCGRDRLFSALVGAWTAAGELDHALAAAGVWPPMRGALVVLAEGLGREGRADDALNLAAAYDERGETWSACLDAAARAALAVGKRQAALRLAWHAFDARPGRAWFVLLSEILQGPDWPARRRAAVARLLAEDDPAWLAGCLAAESDAVAALTHAVLTGPLRDRTAQAALGALLDLDAHAAVQGRCIRLYALVSSPGVTARVFRDELLALDHAAQHLGEAGLMRDYARLLLRECSDRAPLVSAIRSVVGA